MEEHRFFEKRIKFRDDVNAYIAYVSRYFGVRIEDVVNLLIMILMVQVDKDEKFKKYVGDVMAKYAKDGKIMLSR